MVRRPSVVVFVVAIHNAQRSSSLEPLCQSKQNLGGASLGKGDDILFAASGSHDQDGCYAHIW